MKKLLPILVLITVGAISYVFYNKEITNAYLELAYFSFCEDTIEYKIGEIDSKFNVNRTEVENNTLAAAEIWNKYLGKEIFKYSKDAKLTINLVFDERQRALNRVYALEGTVIEGKEDIDAQVQTYKAKLEQLKVKANELNEKIKYWNNRGGAPKDVYEQLIEEQKELNAQIDQLNKTVQEINNNSNSVNEKINILNGYVEEFNNLINVHPEEGIYNPFNNTIEIYFYDNKNRYIHTTAHELGHSLGLEHVEDPQAILNPVTSENIELTEEDKSALNKFCEDQSKVEFILNNSKRILTTMVSQAMQQLN